MSELSRSQIPPGGWQFHQPQTGWSAPTPVASTFDQTVQLIIRHRRSNTAICAKHGLSMDPGAVAIELETYTRSRLGMPPIGPSPKLPPPSLLPPVVGDAAAALKKMASGAALLFEWEETGDIPATKELSESRATVCSTCPKNKAGDFSKWFTRPISEMYRNKFERLHAQNLSTTHDGALQVCEACLCPLKLKVHAPINLIVKHLRQESKDALAPQCWILSEMQSMSK